MTRTTLSPPPQAKLDAEEGNYETRELVWELSQQRIDGDRIRYLIETGADVPAALKAAHINETEVVKRPALKSLHLEKYLHADTLR